MSDDKANVTVIYQPAKPSGPGLGAVIVEALAFLAMLGFAALLAGGGCRALL